MGAAVNHMDAVREQHEPSPMPDWKRYNSKEMLSAFESGARWAYDNYTEYAPADAQIASEAAQAFHQWRRVVEFDHLPGTVFVGYIECKPSQYNEKFTYNGPVLIGRKSDGPLTFTCITTTVDITDPTLRWRIDSILLEG
jgi:hypothetical protein